MNQHRIVYRERNRLSHLSEPITGVSDTGREFACSYRGGNQKECSDAG